MPARGGSSSGRGKGSRDRGSAGCLLWLIVFSFIFLLFVVNWGRIKETLDRTNFNEIVMTQRSADRNRPEVPSAPQATSPDSATDNRQAAPAGQTPTPETGPVATKVPDSAQPPVGGSEAAPVLPSGKAPAAGAERALTAAQPPVPKNRPTTLYFVRIDDDGVIARQDVRRLLPDSDTPLTDALQALLTGPDEAELRQHLVSLIPSGTKLLGVRMQGTTAVVNLSEPFMYNHYGIEGYAGQLKQVVYTATAFPSVHDVQILIDGKLHDYLGGEGVYIGKPLSRNSF